VHDRVLVIGMAGGEEERLVLVERHVGVLCVRLRRMEGAAPAQLAFRDPLPPAIREPPLGRDQGGVLPLVGARERFRVRLRPDRHDRVDRLDLMPLDGRDVRDLLVGALGDERLGEAVERQVRVRERAGPKR
jgi:hypothetical protein